MVVHAAVVKSGPRGRGCDIRHGRGGGRKVRHSEVMVSSSRHRDGDIRHDRRGGGVKHTVVHFS